MHVCTGSPLLESSNIKVLLLIIYLICFKVSFSQDFLASASNLVTSAKLAGYGTKWYNSDPDYPKNCNELFNSFKMTLH